jgi:hypothetical protein
MKLDELFEKLIVNITEEKFSEVYPILKEIKNEIDLIKNEEIEEKENEKILELEKRIEKLENMRLSSLQISNETGINNIWQ